MRCVCPRRARQEGGADCPTDDQGAGRRRRQGILGPRSMSRRPRMIALARQSRKLSGIGLRRGGGNAAGQSRSSGADTGLTGHRMAVDRADRKLDLRAGFQELKVELGTDAQRDIGPDLEIAEIGFDLCKPAREEGDNLCFYSSADGEFR